MRAFQIVADRQPNQAVPVAASSLRGVVDLLVDGTSLTARIGQDHAIPLLRDLAYAAADLATLRHTRTTVRYYDQQDAWAIGMERVDNDVLVSVFQVGELPQVAVHERRVLGVSLLRGLVGALDAVVDAGRSSSKAASLVGDLEAARRFIGQLSWQASSRPSQAVEVRVDGQSDTPVSFSTAVTLRVHDEQSVLSEVARNDLHSLLFRGPVRFRVGDTSRDIGVVHPFLFAEALVFEATHILQAWETGSAFCHRREVSGATLSVTLTAKRVFSFSLGGPNTGGFRGALTFPSVSVVSFVEAVLAFARGLSRAVLRNDRAQRTNLRMRQFRDGLRS
ncbi:MAG: hypothetical protein FWD57_08645, partial [Polyangiaceae bacterium]|nr:hypothetical protein [Polyangiaceae bacterium]